MGKQLAVAKAQSRGGGYAHGWESGIRAGHSMVCDLKEPLPLERLHHYATIDFCGGPGIPDETDPPDKIRRPAQAVCRGRRYLLQLQGGKYNYHGEYAIRDEAYKLYFACTLRYGQAAWDNRSVFVPAGAAGNGAWAQILGESCHRMRAVGGWTNCMRRQSIVSVHSATGFQYRNKAGKLQNLYEFFGFFFPDMVFYAKMILKNWREVFA